MMHSMEGNGNDILIGNAHLDRISGERGIDYFIAEPYEIFDWELNEVVPVTPDASEMVTRTNLPEPMDSEVTFTSPALEVTVAEALGIPGTTSFDGSTHILSRPIMASDMFQLTHLDLSSRDLTNLAGLEYAVNLKHLNLANNPGLTSLSPLVVSTGSKGEPLGLQRIETLMLDYTGINNLDLDDLAGLSTLKRLSLDGTDVTNISSLAGLSNITFLSMDNPRNAGVSNIDALLRHDRPDYTHHVQQPGIGHHTT